MPSNCSAHQRSESNVKRKVGNQVIRKGYLALCNVSMFKNKEFWFVLTAENIMWFKDEEVSVQAKSYTCYSKVVTSVTSWNNILVISWNLLTEITEIFRNFTKLLVSQLYCNIHRENMWFKGELSDVKLYTQLQSGLWNRYIFQPKC